MPPHIAQLICEPPPRARHWLPRRRNDLSCYRRRYRHHDCTLLVATSYDDFETVWQIPTDLVLPGGTLILGLYRTVSVTTGLDIIDVTGYLGHHDRLINGEVARTFVFTVTTDDPDRVCRWANISHRWTSNPVTACDVFSENHLGGLPLFAAAATNIGLISQTIHRAAGHRP